MLQEEEGEEENIYPFSQDYGNHNQKEQDPNPHEEEVLEEGIRGDPKEDAMVESKDHCHSVAAKELD